MSVNAHEHKSLCAVLLPCGCYFLCSFAMNMLTKTLLTTYGWQAVYTLAAVQSTFTMVVMCLVMSLQSLLCPTANSDTKKSCKGVDGDVFVEDGIEKGCQHRTVSINLPGGTGPVVCGGARATALEAVGSDGFAWKLPSFSYIIKVILPLVVLNIGNMLFGFASMRVVNMPMYLVLRRLTTIKVMLIEWLVLHKHISNPIKLALLVSTTGSLVAGSTDTSSDMRGYALVILQNICSAFTLTFSKESALSSMQLVLLNSATASIISMLLAYQFESDIVQTSPQLFDLWFLSILALNCCMCVLYQFSIFFCTLRNSALATSVTGNIKDLMSTICGFLFFHDVHIQFANVLGVGLSLLGAYSFSYLKYQDLMKAAEIRATDECLKRCSNAGTSQIAKAKLL